MQTLRSLSLGCVYWLFTIAFVSNMAAQPNPEPKPLNCPNGSFLVGLVQHQTDRIVGVSPVCVPVIGPNWKSMNDLGILVGNSVGSLKDGKPRNTTCPHNFFLVGFRTTIGEYSADSHGLANAVPVDLLADLAPICRDHSGAVFGFEIGHLDGAGDNNLRVDTGLSGQTCPAHQAVQSLTFKFRFQRDLDPNNQFHGFTLTCKVLPVSATSAGATHVQNP